MKYFLKELNPFHDMDLRGNIQVFLHDTLANDNAPPYKFCFQWSSSSDNIIITHICDSHFQGTRTLTFKPWLKKSNPASLHRSQNWSHKRGFMMFYSILSVYSYLCCIELSTCPFYSGIWVTQKKKNPFYAFIMNNKVFLYLYATSAKQCLHLKSGSKKFIHSYKILNSHFLE